MVLIILSVLLAGMWHYAIQTSCSKVVILYQILLGLGAILTYVSVIFWYKVPNSDWICQTRIWTTIIGYTFIIIAMFERTWQIHRVYGKVVKENHLVINISSFLEIGGGNFI